MTKTRVYVVGVGMTKVNIKINNTYRYMKR